MSDAGNHTSEHRLDRSSSSLTSPPEASTTAITTNGDTRQRNSQLPLVRSTLSNKTLPPPPSLPARPSASLRLDPSASRNPLPALPSSSSTSITSATPALVRRTGGSSFRPRSRSRSIERYRESNRPYLPASSANRRYPVGNRRSPSPPPLDRSSSLRRDPEARNRESRLRELDRDLDRYRQGEVSETALRSTSPLPRSSYPQGQTQNRYEQPQGRGGQGVSERTNGGGDQRSRSRSRSRSRRSPPASRSYRSIAGRSPSPIRRSRRSPSPQEYASRNIRAGRERSPDISRPRSPLPLSRSTNTSGLSLHERIFGAVKVEEVEKDQNKVETASGFNQDRERFTGKRNTYEKERDEEDKRDVTSHIARNTRRSLSPPVKRRRIDSPEESARDIKPIIQPSQPIIPTGPRASRTNIPTGPRSSIVNASRPANNPRSGHFANESHPYPPTYNLGKDRIDDDMSGRGRGGKSGRGKGRSTSRGKGGAARAVADGLAMTRQQELLPQFDGPMRTKEQIVQEFEGAARRRDIKQAWLDNPKSPVANWFGAGKGNGGVPYETERGMLNNKPIFRVSIILHFERGIVAVGDGTNAAEAEKLAALSALYQLVATGMIDRPNPASNHVTNGMALSGNPQESDETVRLADGTVVSYEKARLFMEYYCNRFHFGKPDLGFDEVSEGRSKRGGKATRWEAVMTVGGRKIGVASANNKKLATKLCYLDVAQYLESCDPSLWSDFVNLNGGKPQEDVRKAPHLHFMCSDNLVDLVRELSSEARNSNLFKKAPTPNTVAAPMVIAHQPFSMPADGTLKTKSAKLLERLKEYEVDTSSSVKKMRDVRASLPIHPYQDQILRIIDENEVTVLTANTGSGKSTQTPQYILDDYIRAGKGADCRILVTQPRRLAALALADRVSEERNSKVGREIGYHVRFDAKLPEDNGSITFMTIGILLKRLQSALSHENEVTWFDSVSHIVLDEVHERDLDTDLLLVILKRMLKTRKEAGLNTPKILLMSATINADLFRNYFKDDRGRKAPLVDVPGKTYPVTRHYLDNFVGDLQSRSNAAGSWVFQDKLVRQYLDADNSVGGYQSGNEKEIDLPFPLIALTVAHVVQNHQSGHILVFLPGLEEMKRVSKVLLNEDRRSPLPVNFTDSRKYTVHTLHSTTPVAEQREVFQPAPDGVQRIILATNIAETSVTIPGTTVVVDSGRAKLKIYDPSRHVSALVTSWAGSANLDQRAGRAGRERPGDYYAVFGTRRLQTLRPHQVVEMLRLDLSEVVMHVKALNIGMVEDVLQQAIEPPAEERVEAALSMLRMLGALDSRQNVLPLGKILLQVPCDARLGKLLLFGTVFKCLSPALTIAAILGSRDPFLAPPHLREQSNEIKDSWTPKHFRSDALCVEAAFNAWWEMQSRGDYFDANKFLGDNLLSKATMLGIQQIREQLYDALVHANALTLITGKRYVRRRRLLVVPADFDVNADSLPLKAALISIGSIPNFAIRTSPKMCRTAGDSNCMIHVSSVNNKKREESAPASVEGVFAGEKRLYTFQEKVASMQGSAAAPKQLRNVTRIDPLTYLLFGASQMRVLENGLEADDWLPITGNLDALDDIQRLRIVMDSCFLRVWEGLDNLNRVRTPLRKKAVTESRAASPTPDDDEEEEEQAEFGMYDEELDKMGRGSARQADKDSEGSLSSDEIIELGYLSSDVVRILDAFAEERAPDLSRATTRPSTPF